MPTETGRGHVQVGGASFLRGRQPRGNRRSDGHFAPNGKTRLDLCKALTAQGDERNSGGPGFKVPVMSDNLWSPDCPGRDHPVRGRDAGYATRKEDDPIPIN